MKTIIVFLLVILSLPLIGQSKPDIPLGLEFGMSKEQVLTLIRENRGKLFYDMDAFIYYCEIQLPINDIIKTTPMILAEFSKDSLYCVTFTWQYYNDKHGRLQQAFDSLKTEYQQKFGKDYSDRFIGYGNVVIWYLEDYQILIGVNKYQFALKFENYGRYK